MRASGCSTARDLAVVLGLGLNGLGVVRALGRSGIPVAGLYASGDPAGAFSRYCRAIPAPPLPCRETFRALQAAAGSARGRPVLLPTSDAYARFINEHQEELRPRYRFHTVDQRLFDRLDSKIGVIELAREHGLDTPRTAHFSSLPELRRGIRRLRFPLLVKPVNTVRRRLPDGRKNRLIAAAPELLAYAVGNDAALGDMVFQEVVPSGDGHIHVCTLLLDDRSEVVLSYTGRKIRQYLPDFGVTCFGVSERDEHLAMLCSRFLRSVGYRGLCTLEFARDRRSGSYLLLEANLRSYHHNQLFTDCGLNFPLAEYLLLTRGACAPAQPQKNGIHWVDFTRDAGSFYRKRAARQIGVLPWLGSVLQARSFAAFAPDDLLPWAYETSQLMRQLCRTVTRSFRPGA